MTPSDYIAQQRELVENSISSLLPSNSKLKALQVRTAETTFFGAVFDTMQFAEDNSSTKNGGFIDYNDTSTTSSPIVLAASTWTRLPNNGAGTFTNKAYLPANVTELMNSQGFIDTSELELGDVIFIRNDFTITPSSNNQSVEFRYTLGDGAGAYTLEKHIGRMDRGSGIPYRYSLGVDEIYMGDDNTRANPIGLEIKTSDTGVVVNAGSVITVLRRTV